MVGKSFLNREKRLAEAEIIAQRLNDADAFWFHFMAVNRLGFDKCYELCSLALLAYKEGRTRGSAAKYYNGCIMKELKERGLKTNEKAV